MEKYLKLHTPSWRKWRKKFFFCETWTRPELPLTRLHGVITTTFWYIWTLISVYNIITHAFPPHQSWKRQPMTILLNVWVMCSLCGTCQTFKCRSDQLQAFRGHAMSQMVCRCPVIAQALFDTGWFHVVFVVGNVAPGQVGEAWEHLK